MGKLELSETSTISTLANLHMLLLSSDGGACCSSDYGSSPSCTGRCGRPPAGLMGTYGCMYTHPCDCK